MLSLTGYVGIDLAPFPQVKAYFERIETLGCTCENRHQFGHSI
jgi:hypothetical protein